MQFISQNPKAKNAAGPPRLTEARAAISGFFSGDIVLYLRFLLFSDFNPLSLSANFFASSCTWKKITALQLECLCLFQPRNDYPHCIPIPRKEDIIVQLGCINCCDRVSDGVPWY